MAKVILISLDEYEELQESTKLLEALIAAGVDNWEGYDFAMETLKNEEA